MNHVSKRVDPQVRKSLPRSLIHHLEENIPTKNTCIRFFYCVNPVRYEGLSVTVTVTSVALSNKSVTDQEEVRRSLRN